MKIIDLKQPYATMVVCGIINYIPIIPNVKCGETVLIHAEKECSEDFANYMDTRNWKHKFVFNERFLGNIPDEKIELDAFIGFVTAANVGTANGNIAEFGDWVLYVEKPNKFNHPIHKYKRSVYAINNRLFSPMMPKFISRFDNRLVVPVGREAWKLLKDESKCFNLFMLWVDSMEEIINEPIKVFGKVISEQKISIVDFKRNNLTMSFYSEGVEKRKVKIQHSNGKTSVIFALHFGLTGLTADSEERFVNRSIMSKDTYDYSIKNRINQPFQIIYVPMGGMTEWKR